MSSSTLLDSVTITVLCENTVGRAPGIIAEWGLSLWIEAGDHRILLDTGERSACILNAERLGLDLSRADALVLSHGHLDHTGGLAEVLPRVPDARVFLHPDALLSRWGRTDYSIPAGVTLDIGIPAGGRAALAERTVIEVLVPQEIVPGVWVTGPIPREEEVEGAGGLGWLDPELTTPDPVRDDMALWVQTAQGVLVVLGCAHAGVLNTLRFVQDHVGALPITGLVGGTHLRETSEERLSTTLRRLEELPLRLIAPCHCTGMRETFELRRAFPDRFADIATASVIRFPSD